MKLEMMAIYDQASKAFLPPMFVASEAIALRQIRHLAGKQPDHDFVVFADQYTLYKFGEWDNETGVFSAQEMRSLGSLQVIVNRRELNLGGTDSGE